MEEEFKQVAVTFKQVLVPSTQKVEQLEVVEVLFSQKRVT